MGGSSSKTEADEAQTINESGGVHLIEFHLASASMGVGSVIIIIIVCVLTFGVLFKCYKRCNRQRRWQQPWTDHPRLHHRHNQPGQSIMLDPRLFQMHPQLPMPIQWQHPIAQQASYDVDRFTTLPRSQPAPRMQATSFEMPVPSTSATQEPWSIVEDPRKGPTTQDS